MTLRRIDAETLLTPPVPPRGTVIMFGLTGYAIRVTGKGASSWHSTSTEARSWRASGKTRQGNSFKASEAQDDGQRLSH